MDFEFPLYLPCLTFYFSRLPCGCSPVCIYVSCWSGVAELKHKDTFLSIYIFYNNYNETRYPSPWGQQICFITTPRLLLLCLIWRQWLSNTQKNPDNAAVTFSTCDAWKLSPRSDHYHLWENHKGSLLWKSHISTKSLPFRNWQASSFTPLNFQASGGEESSWWETSSWMRGPTLALHQNQTFILRRCLWFI